MVQLSLGAQRFIAAGQIGNEDSASKGRVSQSVAVG